MFTLVSFLIALAVLVVVVVAYTHVTYLEKRQKDERRAKFCHFIEELRKASDLMTVFFLHKQLWNAGLQCNNFGPDKYGMFRTDNIANMTPGQVFLGNVAGLNTEPLTYWADYSTDKDANETVLNQYKYLLISNLEYMLQSM